MTTTINGKPYRIDFSYRRNFHPRLNIQGAASCVIVADSDPRIVALGTAICGPDDKWSRREGRWEAFKRAVERCGAFRNEQTYFLDWFNSRFPKPTIQTPRRATPLTPAAKLTHYEEGEALRALRAHARKGK